MSGFFTFEYYVEDMTFLFLD